MSHRYSEKIASAPVIPAVAAIPPVTGQAPATPGSSLTVALTDAAGERDQTFSFPVTIYATATITGALEDEARNTIGCDLRDALTDEATVDLDNGGKLTFDRFTVGGGASFPDGVEIVYALRKLVAQIEATSAWDEACNGEDDRMLSDMQEAYAILARIDGQHTPIAADLVEAAGDDICLACDRPSLNCSQSPCAAVIADREA